jgi:predicted ArsR family transcriptional regulator
MRALAHPTRLALWEALTIHGDLTATQAAEYVDESPSSCSFHLRQLAKYGFVEETGRGTGRSRPWRTTHLGYTVDTADIADPESEIAAQALSEIALRRQVERNLRWQRTGSAAPAEWRDLGLTSETVWWVTPGEAAALHAELTDLLYRFRERLVDPAARPAAARPVEVVALMHPVS